MRKHWSVGIKAFTGLAWLVLSHYKNALLLALLGGHAPERTGTRHKVYAYLHQIFLTLPIASSTSFLESRLDRLAIPNRISSLCLRDHLLQNCYDLWSMTGHFWTRRQGTRILRCIPNPSSHYLPFTQFNAILRILHSKTLLLILSDWDWGSRLQILCPHCNWWLKVIRFGFKNFLFIIVSPR